MKNPNTKPSLFALFSIIRSALNWRPGQVAVPHNTEGLGLVFYIIRWTTAGTAATGSIFFMVQTILTVLSKDLFTYPFDINHFNIVAMQVLGIVWTTVLSIVSIPKKPRIY